MKQLVPLTANYRSGFTLIELLTVIGVVGILIGLILASTIPAQAKGRDRRRLADLKLIQAALELYAKGEDASYPYPESIYSNVEFQKYMTKTPIDPRGQSYTYYAPACVKASSDPSSELAVVVPTKAGALRQLLGRGASLTGYCDAGFGWVPYAVTTELETKIGNSSDVLSVVQTGLRQAVFSSRAPLY